MDSDTDEEVSLDGMSLVTEDENSESSQSSESEGEQDDVSATSTRESIVMSDQKTSTSTLQESNSCINPSTSGLEVEEAQGTDEETSSSGQLCTLNPVTIISGAEIVKSESGSVTPGSEATTSSLVHYSSGSSRVHRVGGSMLTSTAHGTRQASDEQVFELAGAFIKKAKDSDFSLSMETVQQELTGAKEVHFNMTRTDIHKPTAVTFGGDVCVGPPPQKETESETQGPPTRLQKLKSKTEKTYKDWTEGMVMTKAATTILNNVIKGKTWVTVTGCPGEGKTTAGYQVLKHLHDRGREAFDVKTPGDYFKVKETKQSVIMLNDIFGALSYDPDSMKKWQNVLSDVLAVSEHKHDKDKSQIFKNKKMLEVTVILISRLSVLKEASEHMGRYKHLVLRKDNVVNITEARAEASERMKIWKCHAARYNITIDSKLVSEVCSLDMSHGFPHCFRLFATMYSENNLLNMKHFFSKPLDFLNQSMESLMKDSLTGPLLREMLKNDGSLDLEGINDPERQYQYSTSAESLKDTYLTLNGRIIEFHHPSVYDSAAFVVCQRTPSFVINHCSLSFLNERVRVKGLQQENTIHSHNTMLVDSSLDKLLIQRFHKEFKDRNISGVLLHSCFHDEGFASKFMEIVIPSSIESKMSKNVKDLFQVRDTHSNKSFLFLMTKSGSDKILRYIHRYVELTEEEQGEALLGVCEHSSVSSLEYLLQRYKDINLEVTDSDNQTPLLVSTQTGSQDVIKMLLMRKVYVNTTNKKGRSPLLNVCRHGVDGDGSVVKMLLEKGADATVTLQDKTTNEVMSPLDLACQEGHTNIVRALIQFGDLVNSEMYGDTPVQFACSRGHADVISPLLDKTADINTTNSAGDTPLHYACRRGHADVVSLLLDKGADINTTNSDGDTPLLVACYHGNADVVSLLLAKGAVINTTNSDDDTPLHYACYNGHADVVSLLLAKEAVINTTNSAGDTPLHYACRRGHADVVSLFLDKGAVSNTTNSVGERPLHSACKNGHADVVSLLLDKGAVINTTNSDGDTPLHYACYNGHADVVSLLLDKTAGINTTNSAGDTPLHYACRSGHADVLSLLLDKGAVINRTDSTGDTPLHDACYNGHADVVSLLLDKGAVINTTNIAGDTPLHYACDCGHADVVSLLLDKTADINTTNIAGDTPLHYACDGGHADVVSLLLDKGAGINTTNSAGNTPLHYACDAGHADVVSLLLDKTVDINTTNSAGNTPLHYACFDGYADVVSLLLDKTADINKTNSAGNTPLHYACDGGHADVVSLLLDKTAGVNTTNSVGYM